MATIKVKRILYIEWYVTNIVQASFFYISAFVFKGLRNDCIDSSIRKAEEPEKIVNYNSRKDKKRIFSSNVAECTVESLINQRC
jgi:hypothetical protein